MKRILGDLRRADEAYGLVQNGDKIAVGLSGGKDSLLLLKALAAYRKFEGKNFELIAIAVDCTGGKTDYSSVAAFCGELGVRFIVEPSRIFEIVFDVRKEKNPCSLCSKLRRGILCTAAAREGCNKVALGHHGDDLIETLLLSMTHEGRLSTFAPKAYLDRTGVTLIRPFVYITEREIAAFKKNLPVIENICPANRNTRREYMKELITKLDRDIPEARRRMLDAIISPNRYNLFDMQD